VLAGITIGACAPVMPSQSCSLQFIADGAAHQEPAPIVDAPAIFDPQARRVMLSGGLNEVVSFRLEARAPGKIDLRVDAFATEDGRRLAGNVAVFRMHPVRVDRWPGWYMRRFVPAGRQALVDDVLVPADAPHGGLPAAVQSGRPLKLWVDVRVPRGTPPGVYTAPCALLVDGVPAENFEICLNVWPFVLPDDAGGVMLADIEQRSLFAHHVAYQGAPCAPDRIAAQHPAAAELEGVLNRTMQLLRDHRLTPQLPFLRPVVKFNADERVTVDWGDYDRVVAAYLDGGAFPDRRPLPLWRIPLDEDFPESSQDAAALSPLHARVIHGYLAAAAEHFADRGWLDRAYVQLPFGQRMNARAQAAARHYGYIASRAAPRLAVLSTLFPQDMTGYGWHGFRYEDLRDEVSIWSPPAQFFDPAAINQDLGASAWFTVDRPPFSGTTDVCAPVCDARVIAWQLRSARVQSVRLGTANAWPAPGDQPASPQDCVSQDRRVLIYPGTFFGLKEPVASVRLKRLRRGMQDLAYLALLNARGQEHIAETLTSSLAPFVGAQVYGVNFADGSKRSWVDDPRLWDMARQIMADELLARIDSGASGSTSDLPTTLRWRRFMELTRQVDFRVSGVRIQPAGAGPDAGVEIECRVAVANGSRTPVEGKLFFRELPVGWTSVPAARFVPRVDPAATRHITLSAVAGSLSWNSAGVRDLPVVFERSDGVQREILARLAHVVAADLPDSIVLDGSLDDWPTAVGNDAASFVSFTDADAATAGAPPKPLAHETLCLVGRQPGKLIFAFRCAHAAPDQAALMARPPDVPDDLVPTGAEAVELLLDPTNAGVPSSAGLYRIAIGPGGAAWQKGVATSPPTAPTDPWPAAIRHAVHIDREFWTAEVEVPMDAFDEAAARSRIWGMNITRFDLESQEYSNWAGAVGNVYDPRSLGNLTLP